MRRNTPAIRPAVLLLALFLAWAAAGAASAAEPPGEPAGDAAGFKADLLENFNDASAKVVQLAEAIPQDKYGWSPSPEVRTVSRVFAHVAGGNYFLGGFLGGQKPEGIQDLEKETDKAKVIAALKASIEHARKLIEGASGPDMSQKIEFFGKQRTRRSILLAIATHTHEHLGQAIAYARSVGVTPPWSKKEG